jgi:TfoX/Sxy family transcriptional regulator of competence genes
VAYDEDLADRIRAVLGKEAFTEKKMFGGLAFLIGGNMAVAASGQGGLLVRVDPAQTEKLLDEPAVARMQMGKRAPMDGWLRVSAEAIANTRGLRTWVQRGVSYARSLPAK